MAHQATLFPVTETESTAIRVAQVFSALLIPLCTIATIVGFVVPGFYHGTPFWVLQAHAQDVVTLVVAVPLLAISLVLAARGSVRGYLLWMGTVGYLIYSYVIYAFDLQFNALFLVYVAILGLSIYSMILGLAAIDPRGIAQSFGAEAPTKLVGGFLVGVCVLTVLLWLSDIVPAAIEGHAPGSLVGTGLLTNPVQVLDLGIVLPGGVLTGVLLLRHHPWGFLLGGYYLVKFATLGLGIQAINVFLVAAGQPIDVAPAIIFGAITLIAIVLGWLFLRSIRPSTVESSKDYWLAAS